MDSFIQDLDGVIGNDSIEGGSDAHKVSYEKLDGHITADLTAGKVSKMKGVAVTGTDTRNSIEGVIGSERNDVLGGSECAEAMNGRD